MQVDVLYLEKMSGYVTDWTVEKQILHGLNTFSNADGKPATGHICVSQTQHRKRFPSKLILRKKGRKFNITKRSLDMSEDGSFLFHTADSPAVI